MGITMGQESTEVEALWKNHNREKQEREARKETFFVREDRMTLEINKFVLFRILSLPVRFWASFVKNDTNEFRVIQFPDTASPEYENHIMARIVKKVLEKEFVGKDSSGKAIFRSLHEKTFPEIFNMINNNGKPVIGQYGADGWVKNGFLPQMSVLIQGINRMPFKVVVENKDGSTEIKEYGANWCIENKKVLLLSKDAKSRSVPATVYNELMDRMVPNHGSFFKYDLAIKRFNAKPWYQVEKASTLGDGLETQGLKPFIQDGEIPKEVLSSLEGYDLNSMAKPSSNAFIYEQLKGKIKMVDDAFGTTFLAELFASLSNEDKEKNSAAHASTPPPAQAATPAPAPAPVPAAAPVAAPAPSAAPARAVRTPAPAATPTPAPTGLDMAAVLAVAPHVAKMAPGEAEKFIQGAQDGKLVWKPQFKNFVPCPTCNKEEPIELEKFCVYCGTEFV